MKHVVMTAALLAMLAGFGVEARGAQGGHGSGHGSYGHGGWHGGWHGGPRTRVFIGGGFFYSPFFYDPFYYPYYAPYPYPAYPYPGYAYPPPPDYGWSAQPMEPPPGAEEQPERAERAPQTSDDATRATYGLVQLRGIPDGASVDLDGRFWLTAQSLDQRWLAVPRGEHTVAVRARGSEAVERRIEVKEGKNHVVRFGPFRHSTG